jgi:hypothetical protein
LILSAYMVQSGHAGSPPVWAHGAHAGSPPVWATVIVVGCFLAQAALSAWLLHRRDGPDDPGGNGGGPGPPPEPPPDGPAWWPDFEREFAAYVEAVGPQVRERETPALRGGGRFSD